METTSVKPRVSPKDFFLWVGAMISLYASVIALIMLLFSYIDYAYPDALSYADPYSSGTRFAIASLIILSPTFLILMRIIRRDIERNAEKADIWVRRWALYFVLFIAGITIVGDLITLVNTFLNGEVTMRFALKVAVILLIAAGFFMHFLADLKGYWRTYPRRVMYVNFGAGIVVLLVIASGFLIIGSPNGARDYRFDEQRINDLTGLQYQITNYWQAKQKLPQSLSDLNSMLNGNIVPTDPASGKSYRYEVSGPLSFKLCATFAKESRVTNTTSRPIAPYPAKDVYGNETWQHGTGETCFTRTIDPAFYPPLTK
jgi:hypothetical protein